MKKILIMGLPGSGKTTLAKKLVHLINAKWLNADQVRKQANDWDFSIEGRIRQAKRMSSLAEKFKKDGHFVVADFVCPTKEARKLFGADFTIWMDTIEESDYQDTNDIFEKPIVANGDNADVIIKEKNADAWVDTIVSTLNTIGNNNA